MPLGPWRGSHRPCYCLPAPVRPTGTATLTSVTAPLQLCLPPGHPLTPNASLSRLLAVYSPPRLPSTPRPTPPPRPPSSGPPASLVAGPLAQLLATPTRGQALESPHPVPDRLRGQPHSRYLQNTAALTPRHTLPCGTHTSHRGSPSPSSSWDWNPGSRPYPLPQGVLPPRVPLPGSGPRPPSFLSCCQSRPVTHPPPAPGT